MNALAYHELLPFFPYFFSLRLYASLIFLNKGFIVDGGGGAFFKKANEIEQQGWV